MIFLLSFFDIPPPDETPVEFILAGFVVFVVLILSAVALSLYLLVRWLRKKDLERANKWKESE